MPDVMVLPSGLAGRLAFSPTARCSPRVTRSSTWRAGVWSVLATGQRDVQAVAFSPDGTLLASGS